MSLIIREVEKRLPTRESDSLVAQTMKSLPAIRETRVQSLGQEDTLEKEMANPLQYSSLKNLMDGGAWQATIHEVEKSRTNHLLESHMIFINLLYQY